MQSIHFFRDLSAKIWGLPIRDVEDILVTSKWSAGKTAHNAVMSSWNELLMVKRELLMVKRVTDGETRVIDGETRVTDGVNIYFF